jgi:hypothetical protein
VNQNSVFEYENQYLHLWIDESIGLMHSEWLCRAQSEEYKEGSRLILQLLQEKNVRYWIADSSLLGELRPEDELWVLRELIPGLLQLPIRKFARISGENKASYVKFDCFLQRAEQLKLETNLQVRQFTSYMEAADWIGDISV